MLQKCQNKWPNWRERWKLLRCNNYKPQWPIKSLQIGVGSYSRGQLEHHNFGQQSDALPIALWSQMKPQLMALKYTPLGGIFGPLVYGIHCMCANVREVIHSKLKQLIAIWNTHINKQMYRVRALKFWSKTHQKALNSDFPENTTPENPDRCLNFVDLSYFLYWTYLND